MDFVLEPMKNRDIFSIHVTEIQPIAERCCNHGGDLRPIMPMVIGGIRSGPDKNRH